MNIAKFTTKYFEYLWLFEQNNFNTIKLNIIDNLNDGICKNLIKSSIITIQPQTQNQLEWIEKFKNKFKNVDEMMVVYQKKFNDIITEDTNYPPIDYLFLKEIDSFYNIFNYNSFLKLEELLDKINFPEFIIIYEYLFNIYDNNKNRFKLDHKQLYWIKRNYWKFQSRNECCDYINQYFKLNIDYFTFNQILETEINKSLDTLKYILNLETFDWNDIINFGIKNKLSMNDVLELQELYYINYDLKV